MRAANRQPLFERTIKMRAANRQPSTNTKTKLDLTNATWIFTNPLRYKCKITQKNPFDNGFSCVYYKKVEFF